MTDPAFRRKHIGGSDIPCILGLNPDSWGTIIDLWRIKTGLAEPQPPNEYMMRGVALEPEARQSYMQFTGKLVSPVEDMESKDYPFCSASLDGWTPAGDLVSEFKCPTGTKTLLLAQDGKIQANYYAQVQWQMFVTGTAKYADFFVYHVKKDANGKKIISTAIIRGIEANEEFQELAFKAAQKFWEAVNSDFSPDPNFLVNEAKSMLEKVAIVASADREYITIVSTDKTIKKASKYKQVSQEINEIKMVLKELEVQQKDLKLSLINEGDGGNFIIEGLKFCAIQPKDCIDWEKAIVELNIDVTPEQLKPYIKKRNAFYKVSVIKEN